MPSCKLERKHYKYVIIGSLASITVILLIVFLSGPKKKDLDSLEKEKQYGNVTNSTTPSDTSNPTGSPESAKGDSGSIADDDESGSTKENEGKSIECQQSAEGDCFTKGSKVERRSSEKLKYVVIEQTHDNCNNSKNANFYITCNGSVVTGLGWDYTADKIIGSDSKYFSIFFIGNFRENSAGNKPIDGLKNLLNEGVTNEKLSTDYKIISIRDIDDDSRRMGDKLDKDIKKLDKYVDIGDFFAVRRRSGRFPVVFTEEWGGSRKKATVNVAAPIEQVLIKEGGIRCSSTRGCVNSVREIEGKLSSNDLERNFYVGEDGLAYESLGWKGQNGTYIVVQFVGSYRRDPPSVQAVLALRRLITLGVWLGDISPTYKISPYADTSSDPGHKGLGEKLIEELSKISNFERR